MRRGVLVTAVQGIACDVKSVLGIVQWLAGDSRLAQLPAWKEDNGLPPELISAHDTRVQRAAQCAGLHVAIDCHGRN